MIIGYRLRELRKQMHMSQEELGSKLDVSKVSISGYETGSRVPSLDIFIKLLDVLGVSSDYLLGRELEMVCENDEDSVIYACRRDMDILKALKKRNKLYNDACDNPSRFFSVIDDKNRYKSQ